MGAESADNAVRRLRHDWDDTKRSWKDAAADQFEAARVESLARSGEAASRLCESFESLLANARRIAP
jgi:hypothetical protein